MEHTVASFLREKACNMAQWLTENGYAGDADITKLPDLALVAFAQTLHDDFDDAVRARAFDSLEAPPVLQAVVEFVHPRADLHDKFWRYLQLFSDTVGSHE